MRPISKPFSPSIQQAVDAYVAVAPTLGMFDSVQLLGVPLEAWRQKFYAISIAESPEAKKKAFHRAQTDLLGRGVLSRSGELYLLTIPATADIQPSLHVAGQAIAGSSMLGMRDNSGTVPGQSQGHAAGQDRTSP